MSKGTYIHIHIDIYKIKSFKYQNTEHYIMYNIHLITDIRLVPNLPILSNVQKLNVTRAMVEVQSQCTITLDTA